MKTSPKKRPLLRWYKMGREEIVDIFGEESAFLGVLDGVYNAWILFGRVSATSLTGRWLLKVLNSRFCDLMF